MKTIEFKAKVKKGTIQLPPQYAAKITGQVRVILLVEETTEAKGDLIEELLAHPVQVKGFRPLPREEIYAH